MKSLFDLIGDCTEDIQDLVWENCIIPAGTKLEIYCNPDGIYSEEHSDGFSLFILFDIDTPYFDVIENYDLLESCSVKNDEVSIAISTEEHIVHSVWTEMSL